MLSKRFCQESFFGKRGGFGDNPSMKDNTVSIRVQDSVGLEPLKGELY